MIRRRQTVREGLSGRAWASSIEGSLSAQAIIDFVHLWSTVDGWQLTNEADATIWRWTANGSYTAKSVYRMLNV